MEWCKSEQRSVTHQNPVADESIQSRHTDSVCIECPGGGVVDLLNIPKRCAKNQDKMGMLGAREKRNDHFHCESTLCREHRKIKALKMLARW